MRYWDLAANKGAGKNDPSWTADVLFSKLEDGSFIIERVFQSRHVAEDGDRPGWWEALASARMRPPTRAPTDFMGPLASGHS